MPPYLHIAKRLLKKLIKQGIHFTIATGRSPIRIFSILQNIPLKSASYFNEWCSNIRYRQSKSVYQQFQSVKPVFNVYLTLSKKSNLRGGYILTQKQSLKRDYYRFPYTAIANIPEDVRFNFDTFQSRAKR